jgi:hypothetical protein
MKQFCLLLLTSIALSGCSPGTPVTITNSSAAPIESVTISGSGFTKQVGRIAPGQTVSVYVQATGESGLGIAFRSGLRRISARPQGYFEGGGPYEVSILVASDLSTKVNSVLGY